MKNTKQDNVLNILFHPDFNRRPWLLTRSAVLQKYGALAGCSKIRDTAGGEFHPALRINTNRLKVYRTCLCCQINFGADTLDIMELRMALEENFDIEIPYEEWNQVTTIHSAVNLIIKIVDKPPYGFWQ